MAKKLAKGQVTITTLDDAYHIGQSVGEYVFPASFNGTIVTAVTVVSTIKVTQGNTNLTNFTIGTISKPAGFSRITVDNVQKTVTYLVAANTSTLADHGSLNIPIFIGGMTYHLSFQWAKAKSGAAGAPGVDANLLDWVSDWNTNKTVINNSTVITPKIFAGVKSSDGTLTGMAIGRFALSVKNASGSIANETVDGIYGFRNGIKTFFIDNGGNAQLGQGSQFIKYNAVSGKVEFGSGVSLNWVNAISQAKTEAINSAATTAQGKADAAKNAAISTAATHTESKLSELQVGGDNLLPNGDFRYYSTNNNIGWDNALNGNYVITNWGSGYNSGVAEPSKGYHAHLNVTKFSFPVLELANKNSTVGHSKRWLGISTSVYQKERLMPGSRYTFSADLMVDTQGMTIHGGVYSTKKGQSNAGFSSTSYSLTNSSPGQWQRVSFTFTLDKDIDLAKSVSFYIYGYSGAEGIAWVKNVSLQLGTKGAWVRCQADVEKDVADAKKAGTDARNVADAITNKANAEGWATKLTYIDKNGIFTGTLSANVVNTLQLNASQITSGTISASRIDVNALKSSLITAGNIEALTLNVTKGKVGGWTIDGDSIYRGSKNNTGGGYTSASGGITLGSNGLRGFKWRLDATGAGALAGGNIQWDAAGNLTFGASVTVQWTSPIQSITTALGGASYPKLTKITAAGIYTGSITASQISAGTISSDRIAAGSIHASKLDAASIKASIINTGYINGLSCTFVQGKIGGWTIGANALTNTHIALDNGNKRIVVYGANSGVTSGKRVQLYYGSDTDFGLYATDASGTCVARLGSANQIAGWIFNTTQIYKNNVYLGSDGTISNGTKWIFRNDGSGQIAGGNISWNTAGTVSFSQAVSLNWKNDIEAAKSTNFGYRYYKKIVINGESGKYYPVVIKGGDQTVKRDILVRRGYSEQAPSDWDHNSTTHKGGLILLLKTNFGGWGGAAYSWDIYELSEMYSRMFAGAAHCGNSCMFAVFLRGGGTTGAVYHIYSDQPLESSIYSPSPIPASPQIAYNSDLIFQSGTTQAYAPAPRTLTSAVENEIRRHRFIVLAQGNDSTLAAHPLTYIGSTGIYTGTLTANQITAGTISADRIAAGSITSAKLDAASIKANIINTSYINGLSCTFTTGTIGGWTIGKTTLSNGQIVLDKANKRISVFGAASTATSGHRVQLYYNSNTDFGLYATDPNGVIVAQIGSQNRIAGWQFNTNQIYKNNIYLGSDGSIYNGSKWRLNSDGSGRVANGNISWDASGGVTFASSVSLQWRTGITAAQELASAMAFGKMLYRDPTFYNGNNSINLYNNSGNGTVTITRISDSTAPNDSKFVLLIKNAGAASPHCGGFNFGTATSYRKIFITRIIAKIPVGRNISFHTNSMGTGGSQKWLTSTAGTGDWCEYICKVICGTSNFSSTHYFALTGNVGTVSSPIQWWLAYATVFDVTSTEKYTTTIDANGIYTSTLNAGQITAGTISADRIAAGSINSSKLDAASIRANIINTSYINGLTCTFVRGSIGGWNINSSQIYKNSVALSSDGSIINGTKWRLNNDGSGKLANGNITWDAAGNVQARNAVFTNVRVNGSVRNKFVLNDSSIWIGGGDTSQQENLVNFDNIVAIRGSWDQNIALPWTLDNSGRRVALVNYKWGSNTTEGYMSISAPSGKYFFEDGLSKTSISFSRELIELLGYGDNTTFFGWIVINRRDLVTTKRYGQFAQVMCQGFVSNGSMVKQKCYDGNRCTCSRTGTGQYRVYMPYYFSSTNDYTVHLTGVSTHGANTFACLKTKYSSYFDVWTADDASANDGGFTFWVVSMGDWS